MNFESASAANSLTSFYPQDISVSEMYQLLIGTIVPRPIAFVSTCGQDGSINLAPFSFFNAIQSNPPALMISISQKRDGSDKDTLRNIRETGEFVVNGTNESLAAAVARCGATYPYGVSEMSQVGLTALPSIKVRPPRVQECLTQIECELMKLVNINEGTPFENERGSSIMVIGRIVALHIRSEMITDGKVVSRALKPLARLGGNDYCTIGEIITEPIPSLSIPSLPILTL